MKLSAKHLTRTKAVYSVRRIYNYILAKLTLVCGCEAWFRPGAYTTFVGKQFTSFDGLQCVQAEGGVRCAECGVKKLD